jgi:1-acyl-sn-glycerol-3-phosphate acyltransferase
LVLATHKFVAHPGAFIALLFPSPCSKIAQVFQSFGLTETTPILMLYVVKLAVVFVVTIAAALLTILFGLLDPYGKRVHAVSRLWSRMVLAAGGVSLKVNGLNQIDPKRQYVFMVNHQSNIDIPVLYQGLPAFQLRWIAKKELLWVPIFGWAMWAAKHIHVNRADRSDALSGLKKAQERIAAGISVVVFAEGTRSTGGRLLPFKRGGFLLAIKTKAPIVPVTINGSYKILAKGDWRIHSGEIEVTVGKPIPMKDYRPGTLRALTAEVRDLIGKSLPPTAQDLGKAAADIDSTLAAISSLRERAT